MTLKEKLTTNGTLTYWKVALRHRDRRWMIEILQELGVSSVHANQIVDTVQRAPNSMGPAGQGFPR